MNIIVHSNNLCSLSVMILNTLFFLKKILCYVDINTCDHVVFSTVKNVLTFIKTYEFAWPIKYTTQWNQVLLLIYLKTFLIKYFFQLSIITHESNNITYKNIWI